MHIILDGGGSVGHIAAAADGDHAYGNALLRLPVHVILQVDVVDVANRAENDHLGGLTYQRGAVCGIPIENGVGVEPFKLPGGSAGLQVCRSAKVRIDKVYAQVQIFQHADAVGDGVVAHGVKVEGKEAHAAHEAQFGYFHPLTAVECVFAVERFIYHKGYGGSSFGDGCLGGDDAVLQCTYFAVKLAHLW